jgi:L-lactate dehydrogenase complex protein LldG
MNPNSSTTNQTSAVIEKVRRALGRSSPLPAQPIPPAIDEAITRLVAKDADLVQRFITTAEAMKMHVDRTSAADAAEHVVEFLKSKNVRTAALPRSELLDRLGIPAALTAAGIDARRWDQITVDAVYDMDCGLTDVYAAVAETGSIVVRASPDHGRALSLVPPLHVAIVESRQILADMIDLFAKLNVEGTGSAVSLITGPSKTSDIEMNLVVGVHGPQAVQVFLIS